LKLTFCNSFQYSYVNKLKFSNFFVDPQCKSLPSNIFEDVVFPRNFLGILQLGIKIIIIFSQQGGICKNLCITPLPSNCCINPICNENSIAPKTQLDNMLGMLNMGEIKDLCPIEQVSLMNFGTILSHSNINHKHYRVVDVGHFMLQFFI
jgi:hypothetical protein